VASILVSSLDFPPIPLFIDPFVFDLDGCNGSKGALVPFSSIADNAFGISIVGLRTLELRRMSGSEGEAWSATVDPFLDLGLRA
jgi:hypothetical protein